MSLTRRGWQKKVLGLGDQSSWGVSWSIFFCLVLVHLFFWFVFPLSSGSRMRCLNFSTCFTFLEKFPADLVHCEAVGVVLLMAFGAPPRFVTS